MFTPWHHVGLVFSSLISGFPCQSRHSFRSLESAHTDDSRDLKRMLQANIIIRYLGGRVPCIATKSFGRTEVKRRLDTMVCWADGRTDSQTNNKVLFFYISNEDDKMSATTPHICGWSYWQLPGLGLSSTLELCSLLAYETRRDRSRSLKANSHQKLSVKSVHFDNKYYFNPLKGRGDYGATSNNMKLVHWPLTGGLLHLVQWGRAWAGPQLARPFLAVPNLTSHPSTVSVLITVLLYNGPLTVIIQR